MALLLSFAKRKNTIPRGDTISYIAFYWVSRDENNLLGGNAKCISLCFSKTQRESRSLYANESFGV